MRALVAFALCLAAWPLASIAQPPGNKITGIITEIIKDENTPTGSITVVDSANKTFKAIITEATVFEIWRGDKFHEKSSFLGEHRGQKIEMSVVGPAKAPVAALVRILTPPAPKNLPVRSEPPKHHVHGVIMQMLKGQIILSVHVANPPPIVIGKVVDVGREQDANYGWMSVEADKGAVVKFAVNRNTHFVKVNGAKHEAANFLSDFRGETVFVFPHHHDKIMASKVEIVLGGFAEALHRATQRHEHRTAIYDLAPGTTYQFRRDGKITPATVAALQVGEHISIEVDKVQKHLATHIDILLPHVIRGTIAAFTPKAISVKIHHGGLNAPEHDTLEVIPLAPTTAYRSVTGKEHKPAAASILHVGEKVAVFRYGIPPHAAELVEVTVPPVRAFKTKGLVVAATRDSLTIQVHVAAKGDKPAHDQNETFPLGPGTKIEALVGKEHRPATLAALTPGVEVLVIGQTTLPRTVETIEIHPAKKGPTKKDTKKSN